MEQLIFQYIHSISPFLYRHTYTWTHTQSLLFFNKTVGLRAKFMYMPNHSKILQYFNWVYSIEMCVLNWVHSTEYRVYSVQLSVLSKVRILSLIVTNRNTNKLTLIQCYDTTYRFYSNCTKCTKMSLFIVWSKIQSRNTFYF